MSQMPAENSFPGFHNHTLALVLVGLGCFALGAIAAALGIHFWQAAHDFRGTVPTTAYIQDWELNCPPTTETGSGCSLQKIVLRPGTNITLAELRIARGVAADTLTIDVPLGVLLGPGLAFSTGSGPAVVVPYTTCDQTGCIAITPLTANERTQMENSAGGQITIMGLDGRQAPLDYSLKGFAEAMRERDKDWRRRSGHWF
jgi:invasion protein IalB